MSVESISRSSTVIFPVLLGVAIGAVAYPLISCLTQQNRDNSVEINPPRQTVSKKRAVRRTDPVIEICLSDVESFRMAASGGATSVELCCSRAEGGVTPSMGLVTECVKLNARMEIHVLIRPRAGHFVYTDAEFAVVCRDIVAAREAGATGVVVGILRRDRTIDKERMKTVRELSKGMLLTFHRAFDVCVDSKVALEEVIALGCDRLLTSGTSLKAKPANLRNIRIQAAGRISIVAASGLSPNSVADFISVAGPVGVHAGDSVTTIRHLDIEAQDGEKLLGMNSWSCVDADKVRAFVEHTSRTGLVVGLAAGQLGTSPDSCSDSGLSLVSTPTGTAVSVPMPSPIPTDFVYVAEDSSH